MKKLGLKEDILGHQVMELAPLSRIWDRPTQFPYVPANKKVLCGYDQGLGENLIVCDTLSDMQELYDLYAAGHALRLSWYEGVVFTINVIELKPDRSVAHAIIKQGAPNSPPAIQSALEYYASGNPGAATVLARLCKDFTSLSQVEALVGWPLDEHTPDRAPEIWDKFKGVE